MYEYLPQDQKRALVSLYQSNPESQEGKDALEKLIECHRPMLIKIANQISSTRNHIGDEKDFLQYAYIGTIYALKRYDPRKGTKVSTFIQGTVFKYLLDCADRDSAIACPSQKRSMRAYLSGKYDNNLEKKKNIEEQLGIQDEDYVREQNCLLLPHYVSLDKVITNHDGTTLCVSDKIRDDSTEEDLISHLQLDMLTQKLNQRQQQVFEYWFNHRMTMDEAAEEIGIGVGEVRQDIKMIREIFRRQISL